MAQLVKALAVKHDDLSLVLLTYIVKENQCLQAVL